MNINHLLETWSKEPSIADNFSAWKHFPARQAVHSPLPANLDPRLHSALKAAGIQRLYEHQAQAYRAAQNGAHLVITTGTASGKTLAYNLIIFDAALKEQYQQGVSSFITDWETFKGDPGIYDEENHFCPGCRYESMVTY